MSTPRFLADENIAAPVVGALREAGCDTAYVAESRSGISDDEVLRWACDERRVLLTEDKDFGELVLRLKRPTAGILLLRLPEGSWRNQWARLQIVLENHSRRLENSFTVVQPEKIRFRPLA